MISITSHDHTGDFLQDVTSGCSQVADECMFNLRHKKLQLLCSLGWPEN